MVLDPIPQSLPVHFFGSRPQPPTSRLNTRVLQPVATYSRPTGCLISIGHFPQNSPIISGSFAKNVLQPVATYPWQTLYMYIHIQSFLQPQNAHPRTRTHIHTHAHVRFLQPLATYSRPTGCLISIGRFPQNSPIISGSFAKNVLQPVATYPWQTLYIYIHVESFLQPQNVHPRTRTHTHTHTQDSYNFSPHTHNRNDRVAKTHRMPYLYRSFSAEEPCN